MYICKVHVQCSARFSEVIPDALKNVELMVEDVVGQALLNLFGEGMVDDVTIYSASYAPTHMKYYSVQIQVQFDYEGSLLLSLTEEYVKEAIAKTISTLLRELFLSAEVDVVKLIPAPWDYGNTLPHSYSLL